MLLKLGNIFFVLGFLFLFVDCQQTSDCKCATEPSARRTCTSAGLNPDSQRCEEEGCCYDNRNIRVAFFFFAPKCFQPQACSRFTCDVPTTERRSCGFYYFSYTCLRVGCCYDYSSLQCYSRKEIIQESKPTNQWTAWGTWGLCTSQCSPGTQTKTRTCQSGDSVVRPSLCGTESTRTETCNANLCRVWGPWVNSTCSATCGAVGFTTTTRQCLDGRRSDLRSCTQRVTSCTSTECETTFWSSWTNWASCRTTCSASRTYRFRRCISDGDSVDVRRCVIKGFTTSLSVVSALVYETRPCNEYFCQTWSSWTPFSRCSCSSSSGVKVLRRSTRRCSQLGARVPENEEERSNVLRCSVRSLPCPTCTTDVTSQNTVVDIASLTSQQAITLQEATTSQPTTTTPQPTTTTSQPTTTTSQPTTTTSQPTTTTSQPTTTTSQPTTTTSQTRSMTSEWTDWSGCSQSCGPGTRMRFQICANNVEICNREMSTCNTDMCATWTRWSVTGCLVRCEDKDKKIAERRMTRTCLVKRSRTEPLRCSLETMPCETETNCSSQNEDTTTLSNPTTSSSTLLDTTTTANTVMKTQMILTPEAGETGRGWGEWGDWTECSLSCEQETQTRTRPCIITSQCEGSETQTRTCNQNICQNWSNWKTTECKCGGGIQTWRRVCPDNQSVPTKCLVQTSPCLNVQPCDDDVNLMFLVDSTNYVDDCRSLSRQNIDVPVTSQDQNNQTTPNYLQVKDFISEFVTGWRSVSDSESHVGIQLYSEICSPSSGRNFHLLKNLTQPHKDFIATYVDPLPYLCGMFWFDLALQCSMQNFDQPRVGGRRDVIVAFMSFTPSFTRPSSFVLNSLYKKSRARDVTIIVAGISPLEDMSAKRRGIYERVMTSVACGSDKKCPFYIGDIWDQNGGTPAERIRAALNQS